jgi:hypothetical protein
VNAPFNRHRPVGPSRIPPGKPSWAFIPVGDAMQRISLAWFANMGATLSPLANSLSATAQLTVGELFRAREFLALLADEKIYPLDLKASRPIIHDLLTRIHYVLGETDATKQQAKLDEVKYVIWSQAYRLDTLLGGELAVQPVYHVWPKRAYYRILPDTDAGVFLGSAGKRPSFRA